MLSIKMLFGLGVYLSLTRAEGPVDVFSLVLDLTMVTMMMRLMGIVMIIALLIVMIMMRMRIKYLVVPS